MKKMEVAIFEIAIVIMFLIIGLGDMKILFIKNPRTAVIFLGVIGMLLCTQSVGKFISSSPKHFLSILGYVLGSFAMLSFLVQLFKVPLSFLNKPKIALIVLGISMIVKAIIARFYPMLK